MVGARGFEPPTPCAQDRCATRLRYAPKRALLTRTKEKGNFFFPACRPHETSGIAGYFRLHSVGISLPTNRLVQQAAAALGAS